ncbi:hypothetical protein [Chamaesiphon sp. GL140_3_metabinner_50]|uniref:hypothetical protein n=1 Tax=Chamaesiphon sp. GL140_3_metabinner_50 TaxID=2970812 RepID=UPI0025D2E4A0|nr:hypothetical protein [Chamaesiphon sp. GL140_3_metabinner_50]
MSPQLQQVLAEIDRLSPIEQIKVIEHITVNLKEVVPTTQLSKSKSSALILEELHADQDLGFNADRFRESWKQAVAENTLPLSQLWEGSEVD